MLKLRVIGYCIERASEVVQNSATTPSNASDIGFDINQSRRSYSIQSAQYAATLGPAPLYASNLCFGRPLC